jgi:hypothetical protein
LQNLRKNEISPTLQARRNKVGRACVFLIMIHEGKNEIRPTSWAKQHKVGLYIGLGLQIARKNTISPTLHAQQN